MPFAITQPEARLNFSVQFAVLLRDGFADSDELLGKVEVQSANVVAYRKGTSGLFWFQNVTPGPNQSLSVNSKELPPYYLPTTIDHLVIPNPPPPAPAPRNPWPVFPDISLADANLPLGDPSQPAQYKQQRVEATLLPTTAYPFPEGTTLIRGTVTHAGQALAGASVALTGSQDPAYVTDADGQFVLYWQDAPGIPKVFQVHVTAPNLQPKDQPVTVIRGLTVAIAIDM